MLSSVRNLWRHTRRIKRDFDCIRTFNTEDPLCFSLSKEKKHTHTHTHTHKHTHTNTHARMYTHMHTHARTPLPRTHTRKERGRMEVSWLAYVCERIRFQYTLKSPHFVGLELLKANGAEGKAVIVRPCVRVARSVPQPDQRMRTG